jgi:hypothetical protein
MPDFPDIYADGFSLTCGPNGCTLTLAVSQPTGEPGPHQDPTEVVARIRFGPVIVRALTDALNQSAAAAAQGVQETKTIKH